MALLVYLVDGHPERVDRVFAEASETVIQAPSTALAEVLYAVSRDKDVRGIQLTGTPDAVRQALLTNRPVSLAPVGDAELSVYAQLVDDYSPHDGLIVASHRARETDAVLTTDSVIREMDIPTIWE
ncbi:PIN domain-containing protein [Natrinema sp. 1APR25-10V2]|uniref:PIN domain-containing protein n=1 Tax=Natrinema sp. 1APR25-10V2 TaxID=2951081 RepID=UPI0028756077|nr:PIN domain-containing protein [Natrinema sp. 1APR25-10V2]MDS0475661.1 PIN domain-containing protein [Natrinema sp. 1APR25-10V2]